MVLRVISVKINKTLVGIVLLVRKEMRKLQFQRQTLMFKAIMSLLCISNDQILKTE